MLLYNIESAEYDLFLTQLFQHSTGITNRRPKGKETKLLLVSKIFHHLIATTRRTAAYVDLRLSPSFRYGRVSTAMAFGTFPGPKRDTFSAFGCDSPATDDPPDFVPQQIPLPLSFVSARPV